MGVPPPRPVFTRAIPAMPGKTVALQTPRDVLTSGGLPARRPKKPPRPEPGGSPQAEPTPPSPTSRPGGAAGLSPAAPLPAAGGTQLSLKSGSAPLGRGVSHPPTPRGPLTSSPPHHQQFPRGGRARRSAVRRHAPDRTGSEGGPGARRDAARSGAAPPGGREELEPPRGGGGVRGSPARAPTRASASGLITQEGRRFTLQRERKKSLFLNPYPTTWHEMSVPSLGGETGA